MAWECFSRYFKLSFKFVKQIFKIPEILTFQTTVLKFTTLLQQDREEKINIYKVLKRAATVSLSGISRLRLNSPQNRS